MSDIKLQTRLVGNITGKFLIPSYQRGYRWTEKEVKLLLDDILCNGANPYSLQPVVVRNHGDYYELIDGQQRLTTIYLIYKYFHNASNGFFDDAKFSLSYETREQSENYLRNIDLSRRDDNIDFWFIANAYETIEHYFENRNKSDWTELNSFFDKNVRIIWYEVPENESAVDLFTRLNIGKIPLTSSELVKALFLRETDNEIKKHQEEISLQWDNIERDLHDRRLWSFLSNEDGDRYSTRIDLLLDMMAKKNPAERDEYFTFFYFDDLAKTSGSLYKVWQEIHHTFLILKEWRYDHDLYHYIGYLIASGYMNLRDLYHDTKNFKKSEFLKYLKVKIKESIALVDKTYDELNYENGHLQIETLLLLFNVESVRTVDAGKQWFPFDKHKESYWSLEHIHAQQSKGLDTNEKIRLWLKDHILSLSITGKDQNEISALIEKMKALISDIDENPKKAQVRDRFEEIQDNVIALLSPPGGEYIHSLGNLALLDCGDNAALSNYVFDAKRNIVIDWDKNGKYIPFCTKMAFFKYYTPSSDNQLHYWGARDRMAYLSAINDKLADYLDSPITLSEKAE